jgi:hypothetical protein
MGWNRLAGRAILWPCLTDQERSRRTRTSAPSASLTWRQAASPMINKNHARTLQPLALVAAAASKAARREPKSFPRRGASRLRVRLPKQDTVKRNSGVGAGMAGAWKDEFPPLLPLGFHVKTLAEVRQLCVVRFTHSITRPSIMDGLEEVVTELNKSSLHLEVWVDGSFATEKLNPEDSDIAVRFDGVEFDAAAAHQKAIISWAASTDLVSTHKCDCYPFPEYPQGHRLYDHGQWRRAYWLNKFGFSRSEQPKGLAVVKLPFVVV